jgi:hypothetical protein
MAAKKSANFTVAPRWQIAFITILVLGWLTNFWYLIFWAGDTYVSFGTWVFQIDQILFPFVWFAVSLWFFWSTYRQRLQRLFAASFFAFLGFGLYSAVSSIEQSLRFRFYPPVIADPNDHSLLTAFGHEWLVQGIGLGLFLALLIWLKIRQKAA